MDLLGVAKIIAPMLISVLRKLAKETETKIDDTAVDIIEMILKKFGI